MFWDPFEEFRRMQEEMNRLFYPTNKLPAKNPAARTPLAEVKETEKDVIAFFELPGADKKDIDLNIADDSIEVRVQKKHEEEKKTKTAYSYESRAYQYYRKIPLPAQVDAGKAEAAYKDGVLRVEIPKKSARIEKPRKILIK